MAQSPLLTASFAGSCYSGDPVMLKKEFGKALRSAPVPGKKSRQAPAYLVPHIDFRVNLNIYAEVYRMISERADFPSLFVILGVGHRCPDEFSLCPFTFQTVLGPVETCVPLVKAIQDDCSFPISRSPATYRREHSLEFVVIWLQVLRDLFFPGKSFQVLPLLLGGLHEPLASGKLPGPESEFFRFGAALEKQTRQEDSIIIASIDGCHVGPRFDHDFNGDKKVQEIVSKWEKELWSYCSRNELDHFFQHAVDVQNAFYFDGLGALSLLLQHFNLKATRSSQDLWYEEADQSFVTFSGGWFDKLHPVGTH